MTKLQAIRWFASQVLGQKVVIPHERLEDNWGMTIGVFATQPRLSIPKELEKHGINDYEFRKDLRFCVSFSK